MEASVSSPPYNHAAPVNENESLEAWARAINGTYGCIGEWSESVELIAYPLPVTGNIIIESGGVTPPVDHLDIACQNDSKIYSVNGIPGSTYIWEVPDLGIHMEDTESIEVQWNLDEGSYSITLQEISDQGCEGSIRNEQVYVSDPEVDLGIDQEICEGENYTFTAPGGFSSYEWHDNSSNSEYTGTTTETIQVRITDEYGCSDQDTVELIVNPLPELDLGNDTSICGENGYEIYPGEYFSYRWSTASNSNSIIVYSGFGTVSLTVTNIHDCSAEDAIEIFECDPSILFAEITNAFTPNNDGVHDTWVINNIEIYTNVQIDVFDRTGRLVFHVDGGYDYDWDGTFNGKPLPMDTYYYIIDFKSDQIAPRKGTVTIVREP
ncbi:hypothetical protein ES703_90576 [subsurface metagenome]